MAEEMVEVRCRSCRRLLGVGPSAFRIYCDAFCAQDLPTANSEDRDALIACLFPRVKSSMTLLAKDFGVTRQRIEQIVAARSYRARPRSRK